LFVLLADDSQSLSIRDEHQGSTRGTLLRSLLADPKSPWQTRLQQDFDVRRFAFADRLETDVDFANLSFSGSSSRLAAALSDLARRLAGRPVAGVLLFTDGNATNWPDELGVELPPIYPVVIGADEPVRDLSIVNAAVAVSAFEDAPVAVKTDVVAAGYRGASIVGRLLDESGAVAAEEVATVTDDANPIALRFQLRPKQAGVSFYELVVLDRSEQEAIDRPEASTEATLLNNRRLLVVDCGAGPYRVLYVSGRPNWEFKFLRRAIEDDPQLELVALVRIARREPKFDFRGRAGESSNPLFRGFGEQNAEQYDQPVLVRLGTRDAAELRDGFPKKPQDLFVYHAIVLDDVEAEFFDHQQLTLLKRFVGERGGGLLMLGGQESFADGKYRRTPVEELLPVYLDQPPRIAEPLACRLELTRDGWLQPWVRLRSTESDERTRLGAMPAFGAINVVRGVKPGASVLATVVDSGGQVYPALVAQRFGHGRACALTIGDMWRWALRQDPQDRDLEKAWRQTIRWLTSDVPGRVAIELPAAPAPGQTTTIAVRARDENYQALENARVTVQISTPEGATVKPAVEAAADELGVYQTTYVPRAAGAYRITAEVVDGVGKKVGTAIAGFANNPASDEFANLRPNRALLERLAKSTGGELVAADRLESFVASLSHRQAPVTEAYTQPLWHRPWVLLAALACLIGEWALRRTRGLP
jgi:uncharacterized membrane protein